MILDTVEKGEAIGLGRRAGLSPPTPVLQAITQARSIEEALVKDLAAGANQG
jgi:hypothetical protein